MNGQPQPGVPKPPPGYQHGPWQPVSESKRQKDERMWAMFCHLAAFSRYVGVPFGGIVGPLVMWLIKKDEYPLVDDQGKQSLNFHISVLIYGIAGVVILLPLVFVLIGIPLLIGFALCLWITDTALTINAAVQSNKGIPYRYPLAIPFFR
jgi:uncharacterized Tic20 family protein